MSDEVVQQWLALQLAGIRRGVGAVTPQLSARVADAEMIDAALRYCQVLGHLMGEDGVEDLCWPERREVFVAAYQLLD